MKLNKKRLLLNLFLFGLMVIMAACSSGAAENSQQESPGNEQKTEQTAEETASETRVIETVKGDVEVPANPQRIITDLYLADFIALGVKPVGANEWALRNPFIQEQIDGIEDIGAPISVEKVLQLQPDLIVVQSDENYEKLSQIAPTVVIPYASEGDFYGELRKIAEIIGKEKEAEDWIASFEEKAAQARKQIEPHIEEGETFGIYEIADEKVYIFGDNWGRGGHVLYRALKLNPPAMMQELISQGTQWKELSLEALPEYAADHMFITTYNSQSKGPDQELFKKMKSSAVWSNLEAIKNDQVYLMNFLHMYYADPFSLEEQLDLMVEKIIGVEK
ncbi:MAG: ABC transporter substrate-binding protein [Bacillaceae bacterium]|nr:ABC transporter substrate-binding protein [Bacillaceae bacterium]